MNETLQQADQQAVFLERDDRILGTGWLTTAFQPYAGGRKALVKTNAENCQFLLVCNEAENEENQVNNRKRTGIFFVIKKERKIENER